MKKQLCYKYLALLQEKMRGMYMSFISYLINGLSLGSVYAIIALGYTCLLYTSSGQVVNYMDLIRGALDYRQWFEFHMYYYRGQERRKELTNSAFHRFSGGEKAMAMYVPLFAAVNAQYQNCLLYTSHFRIF